METQEWKEEFRKKFGQFYVSVDSKTGAIRIVDLEGGIDVNGEDGTKIRCIASSDIEKYVSQHFIHKDTLKEIKKITERHANWKPTEGYESEEEKWFQKGMIAEAKLIQSDIQSVIEYIELPNE